MNKMKMAHKTKIDISLTIFFFLLGFFLLVFQRNATHLDFMHTFIRRITFTTFYRFTSDCKTSDDMKRFFFPFGDISQICVCVHVMYSNGWICVLFFVFR